MLKGYKKEWGDKPSTLHQGKTRGEYLKEQHKSTPRSKALKTGNGRSESRNRADDILARRKDIHEKYGNGK